MPKVDRKRVILRKAAELFKAKGYSATSMRDLAVAVGIEPSSLYSHIRSKEELLAKICLDTADLFTTGINRIKQADASPQEQLASVIDLHLQIAKSQPSSVTVFTDEWRHLAPEDLTLFEDKRRDYQRAVRAMVDAGIKMGAFRDIDSQTITKTLLTSLRWVHTWQPKERSIDYDKIADDIKKLFLQGLM